MTSSPLPLLPTLPSPDASISEEAFIARDILRDLFSLPAPALVGARSLPPHSSSPTPPNVSSPSLRGGGGVSMMGNVPPRPHPRHLELYRRHPSRHLDLAAEPSWNGWARLIPCGLFPSISRLRLLPRLLVCLRAHPRLSCSLSTAFGLLHFAGFSRWPAQNPPGSLIAASSHPPPSPPPPPRTLGAALPLSYSRCSLILSLLGDTVVLPFPKGFP